MDPSKKKALINWVNALNNNAIEKLEQLWDGRFLLEVTRRIDGDVEDHEDPQERLKTVLIYLQGCYSDQKPQISWARIFFEQAEREIGKVCALLVCQSVECPKKEEFVQVILGLDEESQLNIKDIIEFILIESANTGLRPDYADILGQSSCAEASSNGKDSGLFVGMKLTFANTPSPHTSDRVSVDLQQPFSMLTRCAATQQYYSNSPTKKFLNSPQVGTKIALRENKKRMDKLERDLRNEMYLRQEREQELEENRKYLIEKDCKIDQLKREVKDLNSLRFIEDDLKTSQLAERDTQQEITKLKDRLTVLGDLKMENSYLKKENAKLLDEKYQHQQMDKNNKALQVEITHLKKSLSEAVYSQQQLGIECERGQERILNIIQEKVELQTLKDERENFLKDEIEQLEEKICQQVNKELQQGESLGFILEKKVFDLECEKENLVSQFKEQYTAVCEEKLNEISTMKTAYEDKMSEINSRVAELSCEKQCIENQLHDKEALLNAQIVESAAERERNHNDLSAMEARCQKRLDELRMQMTDLQKECDTEAQNQHSLKKEFHCRLRNISQQQQEIMETAQQEKHNYEKDLLEKNAKIVEMEMETAMEEHKRENSCLRVTIDKLKKLLDEMRQRRDMELCHKMEELSKQQSDEINRLKTEFDLKHAEVISQKDSEIESLKTMYSERISSTGKVNEDLKLTILRAQSEMGRFNRYKAESDKKLHESASRGDLYKAKLQTLVDKYTALRTSHERHCTETDSRLKRYECEKLSLSTRLQSLQNECEILRQTGKTSETEIKSVTQKFFEERKTNGTLQQRLCSLEVQLSHAEREIQSRKGNRAAPSHQLAVPYNRIETQSSDDSVPDDVQHDGQEWDDNTFRLSDLELSQLSRGSKRSNLESNQFSSQESLTSINSRRGSTVFEITMTSKASLKDDTSMDDLNESFEFGHHVIPKLDSSLNSVSDVINKQTTGRAGFVLVGGCEDEPEHFDWNRVSEMQRRNTLCPPHLRTAYPIETQHATPSKVEENALKNKTEKVRKRKAFMSEEENCGARRKLRSSLSRRPSKTGRLTSAQKETVQIGKEFTAFSVGFSPLKDKQNRKSLRLAKNEVKKETCESTEFSIGFTPIKKKKVPTATLR